MDFSKEDRIPTERFNRILWKGMMGERPYPTAGNKSGTPQPDTKGIPTKKINTGDSE
jgi:hypothetical protein